MCHVCGFEDTNYDVNYDTKSVENLGFNNIFYQIVFSLPSE